MKRYGDLYESICSFENLRAAAYRARRGKRFRTDVMAFQYDLEEQILLLREELLSRTYVPGPYRAFRIRDPKPRLISAAPYRDRVVHHALCRVIEPLFERSFIHDSYANRIGKGTHRALDRCTCLARRYRFALKCDIEKYFASIDHEILLSLIRRKIKCPGTLWLVERIVGNSNPQDEIIRFFPGDTLFTPYERRRGIPIGNLTSQFFANIYLDGFDHFVKETLRRRAYLRFADDFLLFGDESATLHGLLRPMQSYLDGLRLRLHPTKCHVFRVERGIPFLGWQVFPDHRRVRRRTGVRFRRRLRKLQDDHAAGRIGFPEVTASIMSWLGHLKHGDTWGLRGRILESAVFVARPEVCRNGGGA